MSIKTAGNLPRNAVALLAGLLCGVLFFGVVEPSAYGKRPVPLLDREASIFFLFRLFPLIIIPAVCVFIAAMRPASRRQAFWLAGVFAVSLLVPLPLVDDWKAIPTQYGWSRLSGEAWTEVGLLFASLMLLSELAAAVSAVVSPPIYRLVSRVILKHGTGQ
jgi:hypothetical protein